VSSQSSARFDKFTERARKVLTLAQEEAQRFKHDYIGSEHLLLGLIREGSGVGAKVLASLGVELNQVRSSIEADIGRGGSPVAQNAGLRPDAKKVIELAVDEARRLNHHYVGTEHLLLGLARLDEGGAAGVLKSLGVELDRARGEVIRILAQSGPPASAVPPGAASRIWRAAQRPRLYALRRVRPIAQTQSQQGLEVTLLSLEEYAEGFLVNGLLRREGAAEAIVFPEIALAATDNQGHGYASWPVAGTGSPNQWRFAYGLAPPLDASARQVAVEVTVQRVRHLEPGGRELVVNRVDLGPFSFTIPLAGG
jgi:hypothetical protein